ncbi:hypothetical protein PCG10_001346 [Penicillium crustosum]|uniref:Pentapeptide repeat-containing protein n=1 Tax=Penicillium crustosum TaxID=36656 RepID=A0A9P5GDE1_PENCR|nr:uncharacterized protein N7487_000988 [Penicillium crustosum]KAF7517245.1 hypothetical protein PCG10_001346 [Penicillium crustosum]KAJ5417438.1 hypothetical protein N7487_000988 [Penicillium crustosum]
MIIPITAILALASLVPAVPVEGDIFARTSIDDPFTLQGMNAAARELDARMEKISTALDIRSENPAARALMELESRNPPGTREVGAPRFSAQQYTGAQAVVWYTALSATSLCAVFGGGAACTALFPFIVGIMNVVIYIGAMRNGDISRGSRYVAGLLGTNAILSDIEMGNLTPSEEDQANRLLSDTPFNSKRSLLEEEHLNVARLFEGSNLEFDRIELEDVSSLNQQKRSLDSPDLTHRMMIRGAKLNDLSHDLAFDRYSNGQSGISFNFNDTNFGGESELNKRDLSDVGLKVTFSYPQGQKIDKGDSLRADLSHGIAKHWSELAFSQTGWSEYLGSILDSDRNSVVKYRIQVTKGEPSSSPEDLSGN